MAEEKIYIKHCKNCGVKFETCKVRVNMCDACKRFYETKRYEKKSIQEIHASGFPPINIKQITRLLTRYNEKHNKNYSYGEFVEYMREGKITAEDLYNT